MFVSVCVLCGGCASITTREDFLRGGEALPEFRQMPKGLALLSDQVHGRTPPSQVMTASVATRTGPVSVTYASEKSSFAVGRMALVNDPVLVKLIESIEPPPVGESPRKRTISALELKDFAGKVIRGLGSYDSSADMLAEVDAVLAADTTLDTGPQIAGFSSGTSVSLKAILAAYLKEYLSGKFVDRAGNELPKPKLGKTIGNDTITGFETVLFEAVFDYAYLTPALYTEGDMVYQETYVGPLNQDADVQVTPPGAAGTTYKVKLSGQDRYFVQLYTEKGKPKIFNKEKKQPTFVKVLPKLVLPLSTDSHQGVTALERETVEFVSDLSSQGSQQLSGLITRLFGGIHIGFGILGKISVGDNDTVAKAVETFAEVASRRYLQAKGYDTFSRFVYTETKSNNKITDVSLTENDKKANEQVGIDRKTGDALILTLRVQLKLHGVLGD